MDTHKMMIMGCLIEFMNLQVAQEKINSDLTPVWMLKQFCVEFTDTVKCWWTGYEFMSFILI